MFVISTFLRLAEILLYLAASTGALRLLVRVRRQYEECERTTCTSTHNPCTVSRIKVISSAPIPICRTAVPPDAAVAPLLGTLNWIFNFMWWWLLHVHCIWYVSTPVNSKLQTCLYHRDHMLNKRCVSHRRVTPRRLLSAERSRRSAGFHSNGTPGSRGSCRIGLSRITFVRTPGAVRRQLTLFARVSSEGYHYSS